ncbi:MAG: pyruvate kinase [Candidatus Saccharimonadales bacterium]
MSTSHAMPFLHEEKYQRSRIIATVGPATNSYEMIEKMLLAGVRGFRMNFSHGEHEQFAQWVAWVREAQVKHNKPVAIIQDLQGPKIRLGDIKDNHFAVKEGDIIDLVYGVEHDGHTIPSQYDLSQKVKVGEQVFIYDGRIKAVTQHVDEAKKSITVRIQNDGVLMSKKGINLPDTDFAGDILTPKDYADIDFGAMQDFDYVALSFVQSAHDIEVLRGYLSSKDYNADIIAKIETKAAIDENELEHIIEASGGVMVARGDLAIEVGAEIVPVVQRDIISLCQKHAKISIVATQMMVSMVDSPQPTRAEVSDVSSAVTLGADCVMLSEETAMGRYPIETIDNMRRVIRYTQEHIPITPVENYELGHDISRMISATAVKIAKDINAQAIIAETRSGATAHYIATYRPDRPLLSVTSDERVAQQLALVYANKSFLRPDSDKTGLELAQELADEGYIHTPATIIIVSGRQPGIKGTTDTIRVRTIE